METKYLRLVKTIVEEGNIANSSAKLFLTPSALSHQLRELETQLGVKIFQRSRGEWQLTNAGTELYELSCQVLENIASGIEKVRSIKEGSRGKVKIATECYSFYRNLPKFIQQMAVWYPKINVELALEATHKPVAKLLQGEIDVALVTEAPKNNELYSESLYTDEIFAIMHQEHPMANQTYLLPEHFKKFHLIIHSLPLDTVSVYTNFLAPAGVHVPNVTAIPLTEVALEMVGANMGITCLPKWALEAFKPLNKLKLVKLGSTGLQRKHYLVVRKKDTELKFINDFISNYKEFINELKTSACS